MKKPTVYLETSFITNLADPLSRDPDIHHQQISSRAWWKTQRHQYTLFTSDLTYEECCLNYKNERIARLRLKYFAGLTFAQCPPKPQATLARALRQPYGPIPATKVPDSLHVATAAISGCRYLLIWNHRHIANIHTLKIIDTIIEDHGYQAPTIATPDQFLDSVEPPP